MTMLSALKKYKIQICVSFLTILVFVTNHAAIAQCSMCTKTAQQLGEKPAAALNTGIIYLMLAPFGIMAFLAYKWWKSQREIKQETISNSSED